MCISHVGFLFNFLLMCFAFNNICLLAIQANVTNAVTFNFTDYNYSGNNTKVNMSVRKIDSRPELSLLYFSSSN